MQDIKIKIGDAIRNARIAQGVSQEKLAEALEVDVRTIRTIEAGKHNSKFETLFPIILYLKVPMDKVLYPDTKGPSPAQQQFLLMLDELTESEIEDIIPAMQYLSNLIQNRNNQG